MRLQMQSNPGLCAIRQSAFELMRPKMGQYETHNIDNETIRLMLIECIKRMNEEQMQSLVQFAIDHDVPMEGRLGE